MALTRAFYEALNNADLRSIRIMMKDSLLVDPTFREYSEMEKAASILPDLYDVHDGKDFNDDKSMWNDDYINELTVDIMFNFSHERIEHIKQVVRYLRPVEQYQSNNQDQSSYNGADIEKIAKAAAAGAVAGAVAGAAASLLFTTTLAGTAVVGGLIGAAAFAVTAVVIDNGGNKR